MALHNLPALKRIPRLQLLPPIHSPNLHTDHILIPIVRLEVRHALRLLDPRIPYHAVGEVVALDIESRLAVLED